MLVYNGNLINVEEIYDDLFKIDLCYMNMDLDLEVLLNVFVYEL